MLNQIVLVGRLQDDIKDSQINLVVSRPFKNEEGVYESDIIPCELFKGIVENAKEYCKKGDIIGVKGRLQTKDDKVIIIAEKLTFLSSKKVEEDE